jgi:hypothetical protein
MSTKPSITVRRVEARVREYICRASELVRDFNLAEEAKGKCPITTDPYRPAVGEAPPNYTPLIVQSREEFPAEVEAVED